ncbi:MAG: hydroxymethylglutaryl-CoA lyase [Rhodospirillales bacterium]|jgi:hydroxymethylglutaryl-CoA lyase
MLVPKKVKIVEVGPRDGLQNESGTVTVDLRIDLINRLTRAGLPAIEAGSFVSPQWVPQMANTAKVLENIIPGKGVNYPVLVPNLRGFNDALTAGAREVAIFASASELFSQRNINCSVAESLDRFAAVCSAAKVNGIRIRSYISCCLGCPYEGDVPLNSVVKLAVRLLAMGCNEISLGDTIGIGTPNRAEALVDAVLAVVPRERVAVHFHDTYGQGLVNTLAALQRGIAIVDTSVGGLGGCPFAEGATGNIATEDVLFMLNGLGVSTGVNLEKVVDTAHVIFAALGRKPVSRVARVSASYGMRIQEK